MTVFPSLSWTSSRTSRLVVALALLAALLAVAARPSPARADHGGEFEPLAAPQRLAETRPGATTADGQVAGGGALAADGVLRIPVAGRVGVPTTAAAAVLNVTAVDPTAAGFLTVYPCDAHRPLASNVNYYAGTTIPNAVVTDLSAAGEVCVYTLSPTDVAFGARTVHPRGARHRQCQEGPNGRCRRNGAARSVARVTRSSVRIRLHGELDVTTREATFRACTAIPGATVVVELADVTFLDSAGAVAFLRARDRLERDGGSLVLTGATGEPEHLLTLLDDIGEQVIRELDQEFWPRD